MAENTIKTDIMPENGEAKAVKAPKKTVKAVENTDNSTQTVKKPAAKKTTVKATEELNAEVSEVKTTKPKKTVAKEEVKAEIVKAVPVAVVKTDDKLIKVTLVKSVLGSKKDQIATVHALGLKKIRQSNIIKDNASSRGMIHKVSHLVSVSEVKQEA